jgi:hypothetical protein
VHFLTILHPLLPSHAATRQVEQLESDLKMITEGQILQDMVHPYGSAPAHKINSRGDSFLFPFDVVHPPTTQVCVCVYMYV